MGVANAGFGVRVGETVVALGTECLDNSFPEDWGDEKLKEVIRRAIRDGTIGDDPREIVYSDPEFDEYSFDEVVIRRNTSSKIIQAFHPRYEK